MELILWRHAEAEDGTPDLGRALTAKGHKQAAKMAEFLLPRLPEETRIIVSPAKRTQQTASALGRSFHTDPAIAPGASAHNLIKAAGWPGLGCVLLVGHQPCLGGVAALLLAEQERYWSVKKGAVWWLSSRERDGDAETILKLVIAPDQL